MLVFSHDEVVHGKNSMISKMPGDNDRLKFANLRAAYGYMMTHPGKKLLFMGQEFASYREWSEERELDWPSLNDPKHKQVADFVKALNKLYTSEPALYEQDDIPHGFEWMNCNNPEESTVSFVRRGKTKGDEILVVCNFDTIHHQEFTIGVAKGKYKEILNSDDVKFGGNGLTNPRMVTTKKVKWDGRPDSITIQLAPLSVAIFKYTAVEEKPKAPKKAAEPKKVASAKKAEPVKKAEPAKKVEEPKKAAPAKKTAEPKKAEPAKKAAEPKKVAEPKKATATKKTATKKA